MGRKKIEIKFVEDPNLRQVTFSKRRTGLFKKANELSILTGSHLALVVFSPGNRPYSFGHPSVDVVATRFLQQEPNNPNDEGSQSDAIQGGGSISSPSTESGSTSNVSAEAVDMDQLNGQLAEVMAQIREEEKKAMTLDKTLKKIDEGTCPECADRLFDEIKGMVSQRLSEFEIADFMVQLLEDKVEEMTEPKQGAKKKRRMN